MRYIFVTIPLFFLIILILYLFTPDFTKKTQASAFIPADTVLTFTQFDLVERLDEFSQSPLGKVLAGIDVSKIVEELQLHSEIHEKIVKYKSLFRAIRESRLFNLLFGREVTLALFPFEPVPHQTFNEQLIDNLLIVARPQHSARIMEFAGRLLSEGTQLVETRYGGHVIARYQGNEGFHLVGAKVDDLLLLSLNERILRRGLDLYDSDQEALARNHEYQKNRKLFLNTDFFGYANLTDLPSYLLEFADSVASVDYLKMALSTSVLQDYRSCFFGLWRKEDKIMSRAVMVKSLSKSTPTRTKVSRQLRVKPQSLSRVSPETIYYYWTSEFETNSLLDIITESRAQQETRTGEDYFTELEAVAGIEISEMLALVQNNITIAAKSIPDSQLVPVPLFMIAAEISDVSRLQASLEKLIRYYEVPVHRLAIQEIETITWGGIIGMGTIQPTVAFTDNHLLLSTNREQIRDYLNFRHSGNSLEHSKLFKKVGEDLLVKNDTISFLNFLEISALLRELVSWGGTMVAIQDRELAQKSKLLIDQLINPILEGLAMYSVTGVRKNTKNNTVVIESTTLLSDGK